MNIVEKAKNFAHRAHSSINQVRKYTNEPYTVHTDVVSELVREAGEDEIVQAVAHVHDVLEDVLGNPEFSEEAMRKELGDEVTNLVLEVTNVYTKENYPKFNRSKRKSLERERLSKISKRAKAVKLADITHNVDGLVNHDPGFAKTFLTEKALILPSFSDANESLYKKAISVLSNELNKLNRV